MADLSADFRAFWDNDPEFRRFEPQEADERLWKAGRASMKAEARACFRHDDDSDAKWAVRDLEP